jgi:hypothetical protein
MEDRLIGEKAAAAVSPERRAAVDAARWKWIEELTDLSRRNNLLYFRDLKIGTLALDVRDRDSEKWESLLSGEPVSLPVLLPRADIKLITAKAREIGDGLYLTWMSARSTHSSSRSDLPTGLRPMEEAPPTRLFFSLPQFSKDKGVRAVKQSSRLAENHR